MSQRQAVTISHIGVCTSNLERSVRFYTEALGFVVHHKIEDVGPPFDKLSELPGLKVSAHFLKCGHVTVELLGYDNPGVTGSADRRPMNQLGITHMSFAVDDIDAIIDRIAEFGGNVLWETRVNSPAGPMIFCTDPDGVRIELLRPLV